MAQPNITFSTSWYILKCKFDIATYMKWIDNMLSNVNNYYLVIYSDEKSSKYLQKYLQNPKIKLIIKPLEEFFLWKYKTDFIENHEKNHLLKDRITWEVNMLWCEKIHFVYETMQNHYYNTDYYGWCDIGYFRDNEIYDWPANNKIMDLNRDLIYYTCVNNDSKYIYELLTLISNKNNNNLPTVPIPADQISIAGGFFITHKKNIEWWKNEFYNKLQLYFQHKYLIKDDQIIVVDCIFSNFTEQYNKVEEGGNTRLADIKFNLIREFDKKYDNWFAFRRFLQK